MTHLFKVFIICAWLFLGSQSFAKLNPGITYEQREQSGTSTALRIPSWCEMNLRIRGITADAAYYVCTFAASNQVEPPLSDSEVEYALDELGIENATL